MEMMEFTTAVEQAEADVNAAVDGEEEGTPIRVDGRVCTFFKPDSGQLALYLAGMGRHTSEFEKVASTTDFFMGLWDDADQSYFSGRLMNRHDEFGMETMTRLMGQMIEGWSGRPTQPSSGSTASQQTGGRKSTRRTPART